jgi:hypothetical protein
MPLVDPEWFGRGSQAVILHDPLPSVTTIPDLVHAANVRLLPAVALPPGLGVVKARPMVLRPGAYGLSLTRLHPVQPHERACVFPDAATPST